MKNFDLKYFLAANSCEGFISHFTDSYKTEKDINVYIIKGGPGTGKSSFMKYIAVKAADKNMSVVLCPCSSDPDSLDAVIIEDINTVILDGTAPHTVDPVYPGVIEEILNFGEFWNRQKLALKAENILMLTDQNKALHQTASKYMQAAGQIMQDTLKTASACTEKEKTEAFAASLCKKYIPKKGKNGKEQVRFLCGITPKGVVSFAATALAQTNKQIIIEDRFGVASNIIMQTVRNCALSNGYDIITIKNAFLPSAVTDHIIIPELSLSFLREYEFQHFLTNERRIHSRRFMSAKSIAKNRDRLRFNKKAEHELILGATAALRKAKSVHDELEDNYISAMDFDRLTHFAGEFSDLLFK